MNQILGNTIARLRKEKGLTQEQLASELNISYQAVSKWENGVSSPDLSNIKRLAELFGVSIDELFGLTVQADPTELPLPQEMPVESTETEQKKDEDDESIRERQAEPAFESSFHTQKLFDVPWDDDNSLRVVAFRGKTLLSATEVKRSLLTRNQIVIQYSGDVDNLYSHFDVSCGTVGMDVRAGGDVDSDAIGGNVSAGGDVDSGDVGGNVTAVGDVDCGSVIGNVSAQGDVDCGRIGGTMTKG